MAKTPRPKETPLQKQERHYKIRVRQMYELDLMQFTRRFEWRGLPVNLTDYKLEEMLYYRFALAGVQGGRNQVVLPYAWVRQPDCYGNWNRVTPFMYNGTDNSPDNENETERIPFLTGTAGSKKNKIIVKDFKSKYPDRAEAAVLLWEHSPLAVNSFSTRHELVEPIIDDLVELQLMINVANFKSTGMDIIDCPNPDEKMTTTYGLLGMKRDVLLSGMPWAIASQNINKNAFQAGTFTHDLWKQWEALNNFRLYSMGIESSGSENSDYKSQMEMNKQATNVDGILTDAYEHRRRFANLMNAVFGTKITVKIRSVSAGGSVSKQQAERIENSVNDVDLREVQV